MNTPTRLAIEGIFHPSDFPEGSHVAFLHALKLTLAARCRLRVLHVSHHDHADWHDFPGVRDTLVRWNLIPREGSRADVGHLGIDVKKVITQGTDPVASCVEFLEKHPADLIVLAIHTDPGARGWLRRHVGAPLAKHSGLMTLFIPHGAEGFVSRSDGSVSLRQILIPIAPKPRHHRSLDAARRLIDSLGLASGRITLLHVGDPAETPSVTFPELPGWTCELLRNDGDPVQQILQTARDLRADLMVMTTDGPDHFLDGLRGTTSERVLHHTPCPILNIPSGTGVGMG
ncbi:MAG: universal stress protein [Verrucomicrobiota bacterium]